MIQGVALDLTRIHGPLRIWRAVVDEEQWSAAMEAVARAGGRLVALWGLERREAAAGHLAAAVAYATRDGLLWLELPLAPGAREYPDVSQRFPAAGRMQRAAADLLGIVARGAADRRPWLDHGYWTESRPLLHAGAAGIGGDGPGAAIGRAQAEGGASNQRNDGEPYPFVRVDGDGVHEIAVGPVHAGIIEPGHFRFSVVGEKVLRLEERLGYVHKGIERRMGELGPLEAHRLAGRVSGDSTVAFAWAYCMALESAAGVTVSGHAERLRALMLERERVANHLGDLGALGNDAGFALALAQFSRLREDWLRLSNEVFGHRLVMDRVVPGGVAVDPDAASLDRLARQCDAIEADVRTLAALYREHAGLQDRFAGTGRVAPDLAARLGLTGLPGRASGQGRDLRVDQAWRPYDALGVRIATRRGGDVAARVEVRFAELFESLRLIRDLCGEVPADLRSGPARVPVPLPGGRAFGAGWVEGWRGEVFVALELDEAGAIARCHLHDPSWHNWPALEHAVIGNIVPDFPLINKSFNLSYSGHDL
jgi:Ni,Fe-hydrogenase III large subunit/Ni,Fe-hydrogenase III component G